VGAGATLAVRQANRFRDALMLDLYREGPEGVGLPSHETIQRI
jgi:hypothetical protein